MPNTILKRWNGSSFEELYPKTTVGQISASGTASISTFLRGDGQWATPAGSSYTLPVATASTLGGIEIGFTSTETNRAVLLSANDAYVTLPRQIPAVTLNGSSSTSPTLYAPTSGGSAWQTLKAVGSTSTPVWENHATLVGSAAVGVNTYASIAFTSGMKDFEIQCQQDSTTNSYTIARFMITMDSTYSLSTTVRYYRATWFNGTVAQTITFQYYYSGTTLYLRHNFNFTIGYRVFALL